jgi:hypothetical protein
VSAPEQPKALDAIVDVVLAYKPKSKSKPAKKRKRRANKVAKERQVERIVGDERGFRTIKYEPHSTILLKRNDQDGTR